MSKDSNFLKTTLDILETDPEVKSFIYQQIIDFNPFVTPETLVMVIARDPKSSYAQSTEEEEIIVADEDENTEYKYRIAVILKEGENSIEAEAFHNDIFEAIRLAKDRLIERLIEIQEEIESPQDRINAIKEASENKQIH
jgi:ribosome-associated translation inhibitor RaiA